MTKAELEAIEAKAEYEKFVQWHKEEYCYAPNDPETDSEQKKRVANRERGFHGGYHARDAEVEKLKAKLVDETFWRTEYSGLTQDQLIGECISRAVCRDAEIQKDQELKNELAALKAAIQVKDGALRFYADEKNYGCDMEIPVKIAAAYEPYTTEVDRDFGRQAREALKGGGQ